MSVLTLLKETTTQLFNSSTGLEQPARPTVDRNLNLKETVAGDEDTKKRNITSLFLLRSGVGLFIVIMPNCT